MGMRYVVGMTPDIEDMLTYNRERHEQGVLRQLLVASGDSGAVRELSPLRPLFALLRPNLMEPIP